MAPGARAALAAALALAACMPMVERDRPGAERATEAENPMEVAAATRPPTPELILLPVPADPTVSFSVSFRVGSQDDPPGLEGLAALTGSLIARGATTVNSYPRILEKLYPLASGYTVRVDKETTTLTGRTHRDNLEVFFGLLRDAYLRPAFAVEDFERLRSDQRNALENTLRYASDEELAKAALTAFIFEGTPYEHPVAGTISGLEAITVDDVRDFYRAHYVRGNTLLGLAGAYPEDLPRRFADSLAQLPPGEPGEPPAIEPPPISGREALLVSKPGADASISFGFPIDVHRGERDFYALWVANSWLGEHRHASSHLYQVIREDRGLNYGDYSYLEAFPEAGQNNMPPVNVARRQQIFEVWIRTLPNDQAIFALRAALRELDRLVAHGLSREQFELTRGFLSKYNLHYADTTARRLGFAVDDRFYRIGDGHLERFAESMRSLTLEEVNAAVRRHLQSRDLKIAIVTGEAEGLARDLASGAATPIVYDSDKAAEILAADREIAVYPLGLEAGSVRIVPVDEIFED